jgi:hypothetical protein
VNAPAGVMVCACGTRDGLGIWAELDVSLPAGSVWLTPICQRCAVLCADYLDLNGGHL